MAVGQQPQRGRARAGSPGCSTPGTRSSPGPSRAPFSSAPRPSASARCSAGRTRRRWARAPRFQALRKGILLSYYSLPHLGEGPEPGGRGARLSGAARPAREPAAQDDRAARGHRGHRARMRRRGGRARAPAAAPRRACWPRPGWTWWSSRPAATTARRTSTAPSSSGYARLYLNGGGIATDEPEHRPAGRLVPRRRHGRELHLVLPPARPRARGLARRDFGLSDWAGQDFDDSLDAVWERIVDQLREQHPVASATTRCATGWTSSAGTPR